MISPGGVSIIIPVTERHDEIPNLFSSYEQALREIGRPLQFIFVLDGNFAGLAEDIRKLNPSPHTLDVVSLTRTFGESAALTLGFNKAKYDLVMTLPAYQQVDPAGLPALFNALGDADMVVVRRWPRHDSILTRFSAKTFHTMLRWMTKLPYRDLGCGVRLMRRELLLEVTIYGDQHRFLPILADRRGFRVSEVDIPQATTEKKYRVYRPGVYLSRMLDMMGIFFIIRFTKKPLRFFGIVGFVLMSTGLLILIIAVLQRYYMQMALSERPILLLGSMLLVLGVQLIALGLVGELIIFTQARHMKEYAIGETVNIESSPRAMDANGETDEAP